MITMIMITKTCVQITIWSSEEAMESAPAMCL